jgi:hypothetical protein
MSPILINPHTHSFVVLYNLPKLDRTDFFGKASHNKQYVILNSCVHHVYLYLKLLALLDLSCR